MRCLIAFLVGALIGAACIVGYYEWWGSELEEEPVTTAGPRSWLRVAA